MTGTVISTLFTIRPPRLHFGSKCQVLSTLSIHRLQLSPGSPQLKPPQLIHSLPHRFCEYLTCLCELLREDLESIAIAGAAWRIDSHKTVAVPDSSYGILNHKPKDLWEAITAMGVGKDSPVGRRRSTDICLLMSGELSSFVGEE